MRVKSLASSTSVTDLESESSKDDKKSDQNVNNDNDPVSLADQTKGTIGPGGEKRLFDAVVENEGVLKIRSALSQDELLAMPDDNMPLRHFRAEKVSCILEIKFSSANVCFEYVLHRAMWKRQLAK
jgi:hypothetical protein